MRTRLTTVLVAIGVVLSAACGGSGSGGDEGAGDTAGTTTATIRTFQFRPSGLDVRAGTTVRWTNEDDIEHTITAGTPDAISELFDEALSDQGDDFSFTFDEAGTYPYFCRRHPSMTGQVAVA